MTDKTFEVGKAYKHKGWGDILHVIIDYRPFGIPKDQPHYTFGCIFFDSQHNFEFSDLTWVGLDEIKDYEECIVKDLKPGDKVLLRRGSVRTCGLIYNHIDRVMIQLLEDNGVIHTSVYQDDGEHGTWDKNDVVAILERAKPEFKLEVGKWYKTRSGKSFHKICERKGDLYFSEWQSYSKDGRIVHELHEDESDLVAEVDIKEVTQ
jgi:hypothetical protein